VFTDKNFGLRSADFYALNSMIPTKMASMPLSASDIGTPEGNIQGLRQGSTWAGVLFKKLYGNDDLMDLTVSTTQYQIWDITYALLYMEDGVTLKKDPCTVNNFYYAIGNYHLAPTVLAF